MRAALLGRAALPCQRPAAPRREPAHEVTLTLAATPTLALVRTLARSRIRTCTRIRTLTADKRVRERLPARAMAPAAPSPTLTLTLTLMFPWQVAHKSTETIIDEAKPPDRRER